MYPDYGHLYYGYNPYGNKWSGYSDVVTHNERLFGPWFPLLGDIMGPPTGLPSAPPTGVLSGPPPFTPPGQGVTNGPPTGPPPSFTPTQSQQVGLLAVDPGAISGCLYQFTYVWLNSGRQFWFYPVFVGRRSVAGYRWTGFGWVYFGIDLRSIQSFQCA